MTDSKNEYKFTQSNFMKYKVIESYSSTEGTLYKGDILREDNNNVLEGHKRLKDAMGKVWFVPKKYIKKI